MMDTIEDEFTPRAYQIDLFEQVLESNSIIYLPTGAGKTFIAVMLINKLSHHVTRPYLEGGKRTIFAVNTVALAEQQRKYLTRTTHLTCGSYTGDMKVDFWDRSKWMDELIKNEVLVMTTQILVDILNHGYLSLDQLNLLIFDECHRGVSDHPMRLVMQRFQDCPSEKQPRVLGLTATLINGNIKAGKICETIQQLETTFHAKVITANSLVSVRPYSTNAHEICVNYEPTRDTALVETIVGLLEEARCILRLVNEDIVYNITNASDKIFRPQSKLAKLQSVLNEVQDHVQLSGIYVGSTATLLQIIRLEYMKKSTNYQEEVRLLDYLITIFTKIRRMMETTMARYSDAEKIFKFKSGRTNCIIATDVIEEGVDVPDCTLVVRYDLPLDARSYIQSKGRARHAASKYALLVANNDQKFPARYDYYKKVEKTLEMILVGKTDHRSLPTAEELKKEIYETEIESYSVTNALGEISVITGTNAISLVNQYCSSLCNSHFVSLAPVWKLHRVNDLGAEPKFKVTLRLPVLSPLKCEIHGKLMASVKLAKRSAAMECCKQLHREKLLTDNLFPTSNDVVLENLGYLFPNWQEEEETKCATLGTTIKKRQHEITHVEHLFSAFPRADDHSYLHVLEMNPTYSLPHDNRRLVFYNLLADRRGFAILSSKPLPNLTGFPIFMNVGELNVNVHVNHAKLQLTEEEIEMLRIFHVIVFKRIVPIIKSFMVFDKDNLDNSFLIVPVDNRWEIDWKIIARYQNFMEELNFTKAKKPIHVSATDYELALVRPSYRASSVYVVTQICDDRVADSSFPTADFHSYTQYFKDRHGIIIEQGNQPLLEVKTISTKINCIKPRMTNTPMNKRKRADLLEDFEEHLVPELCDKFDFPAVYWLKATTLPSILHRINQLLIAEQLRTLVRMDTKLGQSTLLSEQRWKELKITNEDPTIDIVESLSDLSMDETSFEKLQNFDMLGPEFDVLDMESSLYPWNKDQEPQDIERNITDLQLIDISNYKNFMSGTCKTDNALLYDRKDRGYETKPNVTVSKLDILSRNETEGPQQVEIMEALTSKMAHDVMNLEILETLGDSFLKFFGCLFLIESFPNFSEGQLTSIKAKLVGNRNLYYCGYKKNIPGMIKVDEFVPTGNYIPPAFTVQRKLQQILTQAEVSPNILYNFRISLSEQVRGHLEEFTFNDIRDQVLAWEGGDSQSGLEHFLGVQTVSDKTVADSVEALIGVYLSSMSIEAAARILKWFRIIPETTDIRGLLRNNINSPVYEEGDINFHVPWATALERRIGYTFQNRAYLLQAFTHPSYTSNTITSTYQRLEFLGDAILDFLITSYIYEYVGNLTPGQVTDLRSALVNNITFACLAVRHGLHTHILGYSPQLHAMIDKFVTAQIERDHAVDRELLLVLLEETDHSMAEYINVPKVLGDVFESLAGAIYLDSGKNLSRVWEVYYALMHREIAEFSKNVPKQPVRVLYETQGADPKFFKPKIVKTTGSTMMTLEVTICGKRKIIHGFGSNKKEAKCAAAKQALTELRCK